MPGMGLKVQPQAWRSGLKHGEVASSMETPAGGDYVQEATWGLQTQHRTTYRQFGRVHLCTCRNQAGEAVLMTVFRLHLSRGGRDADGSERARGGMFAFEILAVAWWWWWWWWWWGGGWGGLCKLGTMWGSIGGEGSALCISYCLKSKISEHGTQTHLQPCSFAPLSIKCLEILLYTRGQLEIEGGDLLRRT